ncbi:unnamed protein product [Colias eurytheme]|nr:unnamed protein product [Colias eurytheme]
MSQKSCCVPGCPVTIEDGMPLHRFPHPETNADKFKAWISNIGGEIKSSDPISVYNNRRVCRKHFENVHLYPKNRLCKLAIPVLHIPGLGEHLVEDKPMEHIQPATSGSQKFQADSLMSGLQEDKPTEHIQPATSDSQKIQADNLISGPGQINEETQGEPKQFKVINSKCSKLQKKIRL